MDDIRREDRRLFIKEALSAWRIIAYLASLALLYNTLASYHPWSDFSLKLAIIVPFLLVGASLITAWNASVQRRFRNPRFRALWQGCRDRHERFQEALRQMRSDQVADLHEVPRTIEGVNHSLYVALRRADVIADEVQRSEKGLYSAPPVWVKQSSDAQSQELYRLADRNIAEYKAQFAGVMAGVQRTEAQSAVFMTTLDTLRMKMIGYRLVGRSPEMNSSDFLETLAEARTQLAAIDTALEELDLGHYPKMIAAVEPPPVPDDIRQRLGQG